MNLRFALILAAGVAFAGCHTSIVPLRPLEHAEIWVPDDAAPTTAPATAPADTQAASAPAATASTEAAATRPGHLETQVVDPNETARFIYKATYDNIWQQAITLLNHTGFLLDRQDYRLGVLTTQALPSTQIGEFWKPQFTTAKDAMENTVNSQRRTVRVTISQVPGKPDFYQIGVQVLVERETNPTEAIGGPVFVEGSGFGGDSLTLRSDFIPAVPEKVQWIVLGHDPDMEKKLIDALFLHI